MLTPAIVRSPDRRLYRSGLHRRPETARGRRLPDRAARAPCRRRNAGRQRPRLGCRTRRRGSAPRSRRGHRHRGDRDNLRRPPWRDSSKNIIVRHANRAQPRPARMDRAVRGIGGSEAPRVRLAHSTSRRSPRMRSRSHWARSPASASESTSTGAGGAAPGASRGHRARRGAAAQEEALSRSAVTTSSLGVLRSTSAYSTAAWRASSLRSRLSSPLRSSSVRPEMRR